MVRSHAERLLAGVPYEEALLDLEVGLYTCGIDNIDSERAIPFSPLLGRDLLPQVKKEEARLALAASQTHRHSLHPEGTLTLTLAPNPNLNPNPNPNPNPR